MITKKQILCIIALAIITVIVSVACSDSPTDVGNMAVTEAGPTPPPEFPEDNTGNKLTIDTNQGLIQFKDLYFKSGAYYSIYDTTKKMYFYADVRVDENSKPYISVITLDEDGYVTEEEGKFYDNANGTGAVYNLEATRYQSNNRNTATVTFTEDGYLRIKFSNYGADITYSLTGKSYEENFASIPKEYCGRYTVKGVGSLNWGDEAYSGYWKDIYWDIKPNSISFTGGDFFTIKSATITSGNFHDIYHNGGLIVTTDFTNGGVMYYLFLNEGNNYTMRTTNTLGNAPYYITYSSKDY